MSETKGCPQPQKRKRKTDDCPKPVKKPKKVSCPKPKKVSCPKPKKCPGPKKPRAKKSTAPKEPKDPKISAKKLQKEFKNFVTANSQMAQSVENYLDEVLQNPKIAMEKKKVKPKAVSVKTGGKTNSKVIVVKNDNSKDKIKLPTYDDISLTKVNLNFLNEANKAMNLNQQKTMEALVKVFNNKLLNVENSVAKLGKELELKIDKIDKINVMDNNLYKEIYNMGNLLTKTKEQELLHSKELYSINNDIITAHSMKTAVLEEESEKLNKIITNLKILLGEEKEKNKLHENNARSLNAMITELKSLLNYEISYIPQENKSKINAYVNQIEKSKMSMNRKKAKISKLREQISYLNDRIEKSNGMLDNQEYNIWKKWYLQMEQEYNLSMDTNFALNDKLEAAERRIKDLLGKIEQKGSYISQEEMERINNQLNITTQNYRLAYEELSIRSEQNASLISELENHRYEIQRLQRNINEVTQQASQEINQLKSYMEQIEAENEYLKNSYDRIQNQQLQELDDLQKELAITRGQNAESIQSIQQLTHSLRNAMEQKEDLENDVKYTKDALKQAENNYSLVLVKNNDQENSINQAKELITEKEKNIKKMNKKIQSITKELELSNKKVDDVEQQYEKKLKELDIACDNLNKASKKEGEMNDKIDKLEKIVKEKSDEILKLSENNQSFITAKIEKYDNLSIAHDNLVRNKASVDQDLTIAKEQLKQLSDENTNLKNKQDIELKNMEANHKLKIDLLTDATKRAEEGLKTANKRIEENNKTIEQIKSERDSLKISQGAQNADQKYINNELSKKESDLKSMTNQFNDLKKEYDKYKEKQNDKVKKLIEYKSKVEAKQSIYDKTIKDLETKLNAQTEAVNKLNVQLRDQSDNTKEMTVRYNEISTRNLNLEKEITNYQNISQNFDNMAYKYEAELNQKNIELKEAQNKIMEKEENFHSLSKKMQVEEDFIKEEKIKIDDQETKNRLADVLNQLEQLLTSSNVSLKDLSSNTDVSKPLFSLNKEVYEDNVIKLDFGGKEGKDDLYLQSINDASFVTNEDFVEGEMIASYPCGHGVELDNHNRWITTSLRNRRPIKCMGCMVEVSDIKDILIGKWSGIRPDPVNEVIIPPVEKEVLKVSSTKKRKRGEGEEVVKEVVTDQTDFMNFLSFFKQQWKVLGKTQSLKKVTNVDKNSVVAEQAQKTIDTIDQVAPLINVLRSLVA